MEFKKKWDYNPENSKKEVYSDLDKRCEDKVIHGQVLTTRQMVERQLFGNIPNNIKKGTYLGGDHNDLDWDNVSQFDVIQKGAISDALKGQLYLAEQKYQIDKLAAEEANKKAIEENQNILINNLKAALKNDKIIE